MAIREILQKTKTGPYTLLPVKEKPLVVLEMERPLSGKFNTYGRGHIW